MAHKSPISDAAFDSESQPPQGMGAGTYGDTGSIEWPRLWRITDLSLVVNE